MDAWKDKRKAWTTIRDKHKIKKGAVSGVSLGDAIDKVYAAVCKGYRPLLRARLRLQTPAAVAGRCERTRGRAMAT